MKRSRCYAIRVAPAISAWRSSTSAPAGKSAHGIDHRAELPQGRLRHLHAVLLHRVEASPDETDPTETVPVPGRLWLRQFAEAEFRGAPPGRRRRVLPARCQLRAA